MVVHRESPREERQSVNNHDARAALAAIMVPQRRGSEEEEEERGRRPLGSMDSIDLQEEEGGSKVKPKVAPKPAKVCLRVSLLVS